MIIAFIVMLTAFVLPVHSQDRDEVDKALFEKGIASLPSGEERSMGEWMTQSALFFLNTPYVGGTLEINEEESLVVNLRELDCTTLVETCLAMSLTKRSGDESFASFRENLKKIRYRKGVIDGYVSRLHYASDWIVENEKAGYIRNITKEIGGIPLTTDIRFMSANADAYQRLKNRPEDIAAIKEVEAQINQREYDYIPKEKIPCAEEKIRDGDLVYFVTSIEGLDVSHVGIAFRQEGKLRFIHASSKAKKVMIHPQSLYQYCLNMKSNRGIIVCRVG